MSSITKICSICGEIKKISEFKKEAKNNPLTGRCKSCVNKRTKEIRRATGKIYRYPEKWRRYYDENSELLKNRTREWTKQNKERKAETDRLYREKNLKKVSKKTKLWRENNKKHMQEYRRANKEQRKIVQWGRRAKQLFSKGDGVTKEQWENLKAEYCYHCAYCGKKLPLTLDHIIPLDKGGEHDINNAVPVCRSCNSTKGVKSLLAFLLYKLRIING